MGCGWASHKPSLKIKGMNLLPISNFLKFFLRGNSDVQRWRCSKLRSHLIHAIDTGRLDLLKSTSHRWKLCHRENEHHIVPTWKYFFKAVFWKFGPVPKQMVSLCKCFGHMRTVASYMGPVFGSNLMTMSFWFKTLGLTRNHKSKDNVYVGIYIYIHVL